MTETRQPTPVTLYDKMPERITAEMSISIRSTFDGTIGNEGIEMVLDPKTGLVRRAMLYSLEREGVRSFEPLARNKWASLLGTDLDLKPGTELYEKLDAVEEEAKKQFRHWRNQPGFNMPLREWSKARASRQSFGAQVIMPWDWQRVFFGPKAKTKSIEEIQEELEQDALETRQEKMLRQAGVPVLNVRKETPRQKQRREEREKREQASRDLQRAILEDPKISALFKED